MKKHSWKMNSYTTFLKKTWGPNCCKLTEEWHRNQRHWARTRWETYLWRVERVGFWDFDFKMISATFKNKVKRWQWQVIKQIKCQVTVVQVNECTFIRCIWRASYLSPELCEVVTHHLNFDLVFTCLWVWINEKDAMRNILFFLFHGRHDMSNMKQQTFSYWHAQMRDKGDV